jgi:hypothetical protein
LPQQTVLIVPILFGTIFAPGAFAFKSIVFLVIGLAPGMTFAHI